MLSRPWACCAFAALSLSAASAANLDREKEALGRQLFFDKRLSADASLSCGTCHRPDRAFTDGARVSLGIAGRLGKFNAPTLLNRAEGKRFFWDGRAATLEEQAEGPLLNDFEMGNRREDLEARLNAIPEYRSRFRRLYQSDSITLPLLAQALAAYQRRLASTDSLYDQWRLGRREHWTPEHEFGRRLFHGRANCSSCHNGPNFTNEQLIPDASGQRWKVPTLRELARTAPYFHDGSAFTLDEVLDRHAPKLKPEERRAILRFLESLNGDYRR